MVDTILFWTATAVYIAITLYLAYFGYKKTKKGEDFLPLFVHGLFSKRISKLAAVCSLAVGTLVWFFWTFFVHKAESAALGICRALFGVDSLLGMPWQVVDPLIVAIPCSIAALVIGYALDKNKFVKEEAAAASA